MTTSILEREYNEAYNSGFLSKKFQPQLKTSSTDTISFNQENSNKNSSNLNFDMMTKNTKLNNISFVFPSISIEVSFSNLYLIFYRKLNLY